MLSFKVGSIGFIALCAACFVGCSSDDDGGSGGNAGTGAQGGSGGTGAQGGTGGGGTGGGGSGGTGNTGTTCGANMCDGADVLFDGSPAYSFPACCADADACGVDVSEAESVIGISGCVELNRAGTEDAACPAVTVSVAGTDVMLPGCCQTATKKCGGEVDVAELGAGLGVNLEGPNFGCQSPTLLGEAEGGDCGG
ncbi:MAG: hypothetical protein H6718_07195 [Polyangiaceae bacterium]|nr:hypothetical protein [Polyangiaceae bacterium]